MYKTRLTSVDRLQAIRSISANRKVLHVGCCGIVQKLKDPIQAGHHLHNSIVKVAAEAHGIDTDAADLQVMAEYGISNLKEGDASQLKLAYPDEHFDVVIFGNMFNYLDSPIEVLRATSELLSPAGEVVITIENDYAIKRMLRYLLTGTDSCFRHHLFSLGPFTFQQMVKKAGYDITSLESYWVGPDIYAKQSLKSALGNQFFKLLPRAANLADGLLLRAQYSNDT